MRSYSTMGINFNTCIYLYYGGRGRRGNVGPLFFRSPPPSPSSPEIRRMGQSVRSPAVDILPPPQTTKSTALLLEFQLFQRSLVSFQTINQKRGINLKESNSN
jgi:hypothetical protein